MFISCVVNCFTFNIPLHIAQGWHRGELSDANLLNYSGYGSVLWVGSLLNKRGLRALVRLLRSQPEKVIVCHAASEWTQMQMKRFEFLEGHKGRFIGWIKHDASGKLVRQPLHQFMK